MKNCKATSRISKSLVMISIITRKRRIVSVLLLIILSSMGVFGTVILNNLTSRQQNSIEKAISEMVIRGVVTDATGTDTGSLQMISAFVDMLNGNRESSGCYLGQYIHNVRAKGQEPLDSPTDCTLCRILSLDSDQNLTQTEGVVIQFMSGWNEECLRGNERVCLVSEDVRIIDGHVTISSYSQGQLELQVVGIISGGLKKTIYCPFYMPWEDGTSYAFLTDCCSFDIRDNNLLDETKEELYRWFVRPNPGNAIANPTQHNPTLEFGMRTTHGNVRVASITYNYLNTIGLWVEYTTSGNNNTGSITYHNAYTTFTGFTLGIAWHQVNSHSEITSSGKDIYATASGELSYYILVDGLVELGRESVSLSGYCYAIK